MCESVVDNQSTTEVRRAK